MTRYNWQQTDWPHFRYDLSTLHPVLLSIAEKAGFISGQLTHLEANLQTDAMITLIAEEAIKTSEIEGDYISRPDVRSSIKNKLGLNSKRIPVQDKRAEGIVELMFDIRDTFKQPLTKTHLFDWHLMLSHSFNSAVKVGRFRTDEESMQIVSGHPGKWVVHFEAPPAKKVPQEMKRFIDWFNDTAPGKPHAIPFAPVRAAIAHLYFESIHPFDDGNGRLGRAIAEKALSQGLGYPVILSLSQAIEAEKKQYYTALHTASKSNELTEWIRYFIDRVFVAQVEVETQINFIIKKAVFFDHHKDHLNARQLKVIQRMMQAGTKGFEGGMSAKKYMVIADTSKATATRDLQDLLAIQAIRQTGSGRSVRYELNLG